MQDELRQEVFGFCREEATRDLGRVRIASKALHDCMMGRDLDLFHLDPSPAVDQLMALGRSTAFHNFNRVPVEQRCLCAAGQALSHMSVGTEVSMDAWRTVSDRERVAVGPGRSWRVTAWT